MAVNLCLIVETEMEAARAVEMESEWGKDGDDLER